MNFSDGGRRFQKKFMEPLQATLPSKAPVFLSCLKYIGGESSEDPVNRIQSELSGRGLRLGQTEQGPLLAALGARRVKFLLLCPDLSQCTGGSVGRLKSRELSF